MKKESTDENNITDNLHKLPASTKEDIWNKIDWDMQQWGMGQGECESLITEWKHRYKVSLKNYSDVSKTDINNNSGVIRTERGWAGHYICADRCHFRRNTLLAYNDIKIVVSTVGLMERENKFETIGNNKYFETMAFHANPTDTRYYDADVRKQVYFDSERTIAEQNAEDKANEMHEAVVLEITNKLIAGETFQATWNGSYCP